MAKLALLLHFRNTPRIANACAVRPAPMAAGIGGVDVRQTMNSIWRSKGLRSVLAGFAMTCCLAGGAAAQTSSDPNPGALTFTGGFDLPTVYVFRGIVQEIDPALTMWPYGDIGIALMSGDGGLKSLSVNFGVWNSLHTGTSGTGANGGTGRLHYEEDFYATLSLGFGSGITVAPTFTAYTSPNFGFNTVKELSFKVSKTHMLAPYGILAFELGDEAAPNFGTADLGTAGADNKKGVYLELGAAPSFPLGGSKVTLAVPVKLGLSLKDYYQLDGVDHSFGFFDIGGLVTVPISKIPSSFGSWNLHGSIDLLTFGDTTREYNGVDKDKTRVVGLIGIGLTY
jgi:hypothetical protein